MIQVDGVIARCFRICRKKSKEKNKKKETTNMEDKFIFDPSIKEKRKKERTEKKNEKKKSKL